MLDSFIIGIYNLHLKETQMNSSVFLFLLEVVSMMEEFKLTKRYMFRILTTSMDFNLLTIVIKFMISCN